MFYFDQQKSTALRGGNLRLYMLGPILGLAAGFAGGIALQEARGPDTAIRNVTPPMIQPRSGTATSMLDARTREPSLQVDSAGLVSGHFDRVTPAWLSSAIERAGLSTRVGDAPPSTADVSQTLAVNDADVTASLSEARRMLRSGTEPERFAALSRAVETGLVLPASDLIEVFQGDESDRVALLAFSSHVDAVAEDAGAAREALARGLESGNAAVREDATRRMIEMDSLARVQARTPAQGLQ